MPSGAALIVMFILLVIVGVGIAYCIIKAFCHVGVGIACCIIKAFCHVGVGIACCIFKAFCHVGVGIAYCINKAFCHVGVGIAYCINKAFCDESNPKAREVDKESTQDDVVLGRLLRNIANYEARNQGHAVKHTNIVAHDLVTYNQDETRTIEVFIDNILKEKPLRFSSNELAVLTRNYSTKLGSGGFGEVYKGDLGNGVMLAVKVLKSASIDKKVVEEQFMAEVGTIGTTHHTNLVRLYGFCFDVETKALVYEYMENGSLDKFLFGKKKCDLDWGKLWEIAIGVAKGLEYLHHYGHKRIIHYDIKPGNVLLDSAFCPKLADFGLAKLCNRDSTHITLSGGRGTPGYAAPELWMPFPVTYKCDVYSFGMMLFEIVGMRRNLDINLRDSQEWFPRQLWDKHEKGELEIALEDRGIQEKDMIKAKTMTMVALWCVQYLPDDRPSMTSVIKILEGEAQFILPSNPFRHLMTSSEKSESYTKSSPITTTNDKTFDTENDRTSFTMINEETIDIEKDCTPRMKKYEIMYANSS